MFDSPAGIEQIIPLVGDMNLDTEIIVGKPASFNLRITCSSIGFPLIGSNAFGVLSVSGLRRVPKPAAKIIAFIILR